MGEVFEMREKLLKGAMGSVRMNFSIASFPYGGFFSGVLLFMNTQNGKLYVQGHVHRSCILH